MDFEDFWKAYPRRIAKMNARTAWDKAIKLASAEEIVNAAKVYAQWLTQPGWKPHPKHPTTWLNSGGWLDELESKPAFDAAAFKAQMEVDRKAREEARLWKENLMSKGKH